VVGRELATTTINRYNDRVSELHEDIKKIEHFLYRAERYQRGIERAQSELLKGIPWKFEQ
jgi:hypothetical protein